VAGSNRSNGAVETFSVTAKKDWAPARAPRRIWDSGFDVLPEDAGQRPVKVAAVTTLFWIVKILTTGMGETTSDFFVRRYDPAFVVMIGAVLFVAALLLQWTRRSYVPWIYWLAVVMVSVFGTMAADVTHVVLGVPYLVSSVAFALALAAIFLAWLRVEGTISIHSISTPRREVFYWLAVVTTFALGTATGDLTATTFHLGYLASGMLFAVLFCIPAFAWWRLGLDPILAFWFAYIVTRPLGASFADWMGVPPDRGGLDWGTGVVSLALALLIAALVGYMSAAHPRTSTADTGRNGEPALD
jgi:uncharacterized membrane-anchored protein